jgi:hypothetical protein
MTAEHDGLRQAATFAHETLVRLKIARTLREGALAGGSADEVSKVVNRLRDALARTPVSEIDCLANVSVPEAVPDTEGRDELVAWEALEKIAAWEASDAARGTVAYSIWEQLTGIASSALARKGEGTG